MELVKAGRGELPQRKETDEDYNPYLEKVSKEPT